MRLLGSASRRALLLTPGLCLALQPRRFVAFAATGTSAAVATANSAAAATSTSRGIPESGPEHLVVLIHGLAGSHNDLSYLARAVSEAGGTHVHCHAVAANAGLRTVDGIVRGGRRASDEVRLVAQQLPSLRRISVVGNSLGGLYGRYMIAELADENAAGEPVTICGMEPAAFVTIASPHLGVANLTYWPLPSAVEGGFASLLQDTGGDLFRRDGESLLHRLATHARFLEPLAAFSRRRVYGNLRGDFLVLPESALFLPDPSKIKMWRKYAVVTHQAIKEEAGGPGDSPSSIQLQLDEIDRAAEESAAQQALPGGSRQPAQSTPASVMGALTEAFRSISSMRGLALGERLEELMSKEESLGRIVAIFDSRTSQAPDPAFLESPVRAERIVRMLKALEEGERLPEPLRNGLSQPLRALQQLQLPSLELPAADGMVLPSIPSARASVDPELLEMARSLDALGWSKVLVDFPNARLPLNHNRICALSRSPLAEILWQGGRGIMDDAAAFILDTNGDRDKERADRADRSESEAQAP